MLLSALALLFLTGMVLWIAQPHRRSGAGWLAALPPALITAWQIAQIPLLQEQGAYTESYSWIPTLGLDLSFRLDGLALLFGLVVTGVGAAVALYTHDYLDEEPRQGYFYLALFAFMASMLGLVWADNLLALFVFWEGTSITSYLLIGFDHRNPRARAGARNALIVTGLGGLALLAGLVLLGQQVGSYAIADMVAAPLPTEQPVIASALVLILLGAFTKSAQWPFHFWLPGAMAAPTPASAYLHSATMVKAGIYLLARLQPALGHSDLWFWSLLSVGGITMLSGAIIAINHWDMKALLAYATVSQLGILTMLLAFDTQAAAVAVVVGVLAHALYKGPLFLIAGIVDHATGTRDLRRLAGLLRALPATGATALLAGLSMAGLPPFFGFMAKELLLETAYESITHGSRLIGWSVLVAAGVAGAFFVAYSLALLWEAFLRKESTAVEQADVHHRPGFRFVLPPLLLVLVGVAAPFLLHPLARLVDPAASTIAAQPIHTELALWHGFTPVFLTSLTAITGGVLVFLARDPVRRALSTLPEQTRTVILFQDMLEGLYRMAGWTARMAQGRTLASQAGVVLLIALLPLLAALDYTSAGALLPDLSAAPIQPPELILTLLMIVAAIATIRAPTRLGAIISLGVVGVVVTLFYVFFSAPDLALTQLLIEVLTLVLLVFVFYRLPDDRRPPIRSWRRAYILLVSLSAGLLGAGLVLFNASTSYQAGEPISRYFTEKAVPLGHGANVVNVILVDFRGFDTMGEITVLALAALGGYALLHAPRVRLRRMLPSGSEAPPPAEQPTRAVAHREGPGRPTAPDAHT